MNFSSGAVARHVSSTIMTEVDQQEAREQNLQLREEGTTARERINAINRRMTAGRLTIEGRHYHLDQNVLDHVRRRQAQQDAEDGQKRRKEELHYLKLCYKADQALARQGGSLDVKKWSNLSDIATYIKPLKEPGDSTMPKKRNKLEQRFNSWLCRSRRQIVSDNNVSNDFREWCEQQETPNRGN